LIILDFQAILRHGCVCKKHNHKVSGDADDFLLDGFSKGCLLLPSAQAKGLLVVKLGLGQLQLLAPDLVARAFPSSITQEVGGLDVPFMA